MDDPDIVKGETVRPKRRRRWLQFSLRSLLIFVLLCALANAWLSRKVAQKHAEREAAEALAKLGNNVIYDYQRGPAPAGAPAPVSKWIQNLFGENLFNSVEQVNCTAYTDNDLRNLPPLTVLKTLRLTLTPQVTDAGLANLKGLPLLQWLAIDGVDISDAVLVNLKELPRLESLFLAGNRITDAGLKNLRGLTKLRELSLREENLTDDGLRIADLADLTDLTELDLTATRVTDAGLVHLKGLTKLAKLTLDATLVTDAGVANLQKALPNCKISYWHSDEPFKPK